MNSKDLQEVLSSAFENIKVGVHIYHLENRKDDKSLRMVYANKYSEALIGQKVSSMVGKTIDECFPGIRKKGLPQKYREVVVSGKSISFQDINYKDQHINGAFSIEAYPVAHDCMVAMFDNITARVQAEADLNTRNEELSELNSIMVNRELKMVELKDQIASLKAELDNIYKEK
jgi:predicted RNase H-like nuclease